VRVRVADGPCNAEGTRLPGEELWLIGEWRDEAYPVHSGSSKCSVWARGVRRFER
jgi:hypothetical protein